MPRGAGIALRDWGPRSSIFVHILSSSSEADKPIQELYFEAQHEQDFRSTFQSIASSVPEPDKLDKVIISVPIYLTPDQKKEVLSAAESAGLIICRTWHDHGRVVLRHPTMPGAADYNLQNELILDIGPTSAACRVLTVEVEDNIPYSDVIAEFTLPNFGDVTEIIQKLIDPALETLKSTPTEAGSDVKHITIIDCCPDQVPGLCEQLQSKLPNVSMVIEPESHLAFAAASIALEAAYPRNIPDNACTFNVAPIRVGIAKADGFVVPVIPRNTTLPTHKSAFLTTVQDGQKKVTIPIVVGVSPRVKDNKLIAELTLEDLAPRKKGEAVIRVALDVEHLGETHITAEEIGEELLSPAKNTIDLLDVVGNDLKWKDIETILNQFETLQLDEEAHEAEAKWAGEAVQGALFEHGILQGA